MSKPLKIGLALVSLVVVILAVAVGVVVTLDPNDHKGWIANQFESATGLNLALEGNIEHSLYPWLGVGVEGVVIGLDPRFSDQPLLRAGNARVRLKTLPALRGRYEIDTVVLEQARLNLVIDENGQANWSGALAADEAAEEPATTSTSSLPLDNVILGGVDIQDAFLRFEDRRSGAVYELSGIDLGVDPLVYGAPVNVTARLDLSSSQPQVQGDAALTAVLNYDLDNQRYSVSPFELNANLRGPTLPQGASSLTFLMDVILDQGADALTVETLEFTGLDTRLTASIQGRDVTSNRASFQSSFNATGEDLAVLFRAAEIEPLAAQLAGLMDRSFAVEASATFDRASDTINFRLADGQMLGADLSGALRASALGTERAEVEGMLNAAGPDFPLLVEVAGQLSGGRESLLSRAGREMRGVPQRSFSIDASFDANLGSGEVSVPTLEATIIGASLNGNLTASELQTEQPKISGNLTTQGPDLPLLIAIAAWFQADGGTDSELFRFAERIGTLADKSFAANAEFDVDLEQGNVRVPVLDARALGMTLAGRIEARNMNNRNGTVDGSLTLNGTQPAELLRAVEQTELAEVLQRLALEVQVSGSRENLAVNPLRAELVVAGPRIPNSPATLALDAATRVNLERETLEVDSFSASGLGLNASGQVSVASLLEAPEFSGRLSVAEFNLRSFLQQLGQPVPETADPDVLRSVGISTGFAGSASSAAVSDLVLTLDETTLRGNVSVADFDRFATRFDLQVDSIDLDRYLPPSATETAAAGTSTGSGELPMDALRDLMVQGDARIDELTVSGVRLSAVNVSVNGADGQLSLSPVSTSLYEGTFNGSLRLSAVDEVPSVQVEADLREVNLDGLLFDLMDATYVSGRGNVQLSLNGRGAEVNAIKRSLGGSGQVQLEDGVLQGVDVAGVLTQLETMIRSRRPGNLQRGEQTAFDSFSASLTVTDGVIRSNDMLIRSPGFQVSGRGTLLNLADETIAFDLVTSVDQSTAVSNDQEFDIGGYSLPIACSGTLAAPRCLPDAGEILRNAVQRELQDRVIDLLDRNLGRSNPQDQTAPQSADQQTTETQQPAQDPGLQPTQQDPQQPQQNQQQPPADPRQELINRALDRIFN